MDKREGLVGVEDIAVGYGVRRVEEQRGAAEKDERDDYDRNESKRHKQIPPSRTSTLFPFFIFNQKTQTAEELEQATSQYKKNLIDLKKRYKKDTL